MARIPDIGDMGQRRLPRAAGGVVRNRAGEIFGGALQEAGDTVQRVQDREREIEDRRQIAEAKRDVIVADSEVSGELAADGDFQTHEARYRKRMGEARAKASEKIQRGQARELFLLDTDVDVARGVEALRKQVAVKERGFRFQSLQNDIGTITDAALREPSEAKRSAYLQSLNQRIKVEQDAGTIDAADADAMRREASAKYADAWLDSLPLKDQVRVLGSPDGTTAEFLPEPLRLQRYEQAKARYRTEGANESGRALADSLVAKHGYNFGAAVAEARQHEDTSISDNAVARLKERQQYAEHQRDQGYEQAYDDALAWVNDGKPFEDMPENIRRRLKPSVVAAFRKVATGGGLAGKPDGDRLFMELWTESLVNKDSFLKRDLAEHHGDLTTAQRDKLATRKQRIMTGADDPDEMSTAERSDLKSMGVVMFGGAVGGRKSAKAKAEERQRELDLAYVERRVEFMRKHQRPPDKTERDEILRGMATKLVVDGEAKLAYQVDQKEYRNVDMSSIVVPDDDRREIIAAFTKHNVALKAAGDRRRYPITDEAIKRFYLLQSGALVGGE